MYGMTYNNVDNDNIMLSVNGNYSYKNVCVIREK